MVNGIASGKKQKFEKSGRPIDAPRFEVKDHTKSRIAKKPTAESLPTTSPSIPRELAAKSNDTSSPKADPVFQQAALDRAKAAAKILGYPSVVELNAKLDKVAGVTRQGGTQVALATLDGNDSITFTYSKIYGWSPNCPDLERLGYLQYKDHAPVVVEPYVPPAPVKRSGYDDFNYSYGGYRKGNW